MVLEKEQGYLKTDRWYYDYTKSEFIDLVKKYPYIPFFVENSSGEDKYYRWNPEIGILETVNAIQILFGNWKPGDIHIKSMIPSKPYLTFIVYTDALARAMCNKREGVEIIINSVGQELVPRKIKTIGSAAYQNRVVASKCV